LNYNYDQTMQIELLNELAYGTIVVCLTNNHIHTRCFFALL